MWFLLDQRREVQSWVQQLLPAVGTLDPQARAELAWAAAVMDVAVGDDAAALADRRRLAPLLAGIGDPFLHAVSQLALGWTLPLTGDLAGALREVTVALDELRGQDEPVFTAMAAFTAGHLYMTLGRYDDALHDMREARDLAERAGGDWLGAGSRMQLGILAVLQGRPDEARELLDEALDRSLAARSTPWVTLCLAGYAQLASADGDPERAALPEGAAEGLRRRAGLRVWPTLRHSEDQLVAQVRQTLGAERFDQAFSAGSRLAQQQAVAIARASAAPRPRRPEPLRTTARKLLPGASCAGEPAPALRCRPSPPGQPRTGTGGLLAAAASRLLSGPGSPVQKADLGGQRAVGPLVASPAQAAP